MRDNGRGTGETEVNKTDVRIDRCGFGTLVIDGRTYTDDLIILPHGEVRKPWRRKRGHGLTMDDLRGLIDADPEVIVMGTGMSGGVKPDKTLESDLGKRGIEFVATSNEEAIRTFNTLKRSKKVGAGFHLTC